MTEQNDKGKQGKDAEKKTAKNTSKKKQAKKRIPYLSCPEGLDLKTWQIQLRRQAARDEKLSIKCVDEERFPGEYSVLNPKTRQEYKVVYRGAQSTWNFCSCMDFKTSCIGTCKHIEAVKRWLGKRHHVRREIPSYTSVYLDYNGERRVRIRIGCDNEEEFRKLAIEYFDDDFVLKQSSFAHFDEFLRKARAIDDTFRCYKDALRFVLERRERVNREKWIDSLTEQDFKDLLHINLYPYQEEGIRFAAKAGRAIIADEMGLGKTVQAIGTAELLRRRGLVASVLILCPTSLKYQWKREIERFTGQTVHVIEGDHLKRRAQYALDVPYKIISYNAMSNDVQVLGRIQTDMLVIDEVQRLKNWSTQISVAARRIDSDYTVVLSGTPLENRLEELYSVMEFVDNFCLAPYYQFRNRYIMTDEKGATLGYRNLNEIGERLRPYLVRRRKATVKLQMPARQDKNLMVPMTNEQMAIHNEYRGYVSNILRKWERMHFLSETDRNRLMLLLSQMRMVCDSTYILDQKSRYDTKVGEVMNIISNVIESGDEKIVVFSQWERMTRLIASDMDSAGIRYEYLHGGIPSVRRKDLVNNFMDDPECRVFLSTDAGSTGLNLQSASIVINMDLPWNPAVLEQRIARIYRIGQQKNIQVINLVSADTFEEDMLGKLRFKSSMFEGVLDGGEDTIFASESRFQKMMEELSETMNVQEDTHAEGVTINVNEEEPAASESEHDTVISELEDMEERNPEEAATASNMEDGGQPEPEMSERKRQPVHPNQLVEQGISFFAGLAETLKSPEATKQLVDNIVEKNPDTGETHIRIPVPDKNTVVQLFDLVGKLFASK